jgi:SCP-2 sterol transfer family
MATREELREAIQDYVMRANANPRVKSSLRAWSAVIHLEPTDEDAPFTLTVREGELTGLDDGHVGDADLIVRGGSEDLCNVFWGDANPGSQYLNQAITIRGRADDVMRLDAIAMLVYLDTQAQGRD